MLREMQIIDPPYKCKQAFDQICNPLFQKIKRNLNESKALEEIKDAMLPKLFSGEIRVSEAEKILDEAGI
jgi:type I restriction enzyme S subunit